MTETSEIWTGKASSYDRARPTPPADLLHLLTQLIHLPHPTLVVDLGSGTGLSTAIWAEQAEKVIGIEPNADMRQVATRAIADHPYASHIDYRAGVAHQTDLPDGCADIVTAAQSFHWMEPTSTLAEVARILRPGGLLAVYDYEWPPLIAWELDQLLQEENRRMMKLIQERGLARTLNIWPKSKHLENIRASGHFRYTREFILHHRENGDATRFMEMLQSTAFYSNQFQFTDQELGLDQIKHTLSKTLGSEEVPWYWNYRILIGMR
jgi:ubiquinone/menaquinone biosynthesis C-methylase UbiE